MSDKPHTPTAIYLTKESDCGCTISRDESGDPCCQFCPKHAAVDALVKALNVLADAAEVLSKVSGGARTALLDGIIAARAALQQAGEA